MSAKSLLIVLLVIAFAASDTAVGQTTAPNKTTAPAPQGSKPAIRTEPSPNWLTAGCESRLTDKAQAYVGDGDDLYAQNYGGGMSMIAMVTGDDKRSHSYLAGEVSSHAGSVILMAHCTFDYTSAATQTFHPLDMELDGNVGALMAAGIASSYPFAKSAATWDRLRKTVVWRVKQGDGGGSVSYVFGVPKKNPSVWKLMYHGIQIAELKPEKE